MGPVRHVALGNSSYLTCRFCIVPWFICTSLVANEKYSLIRLLHLQCICFSQFSACVIGEWDTFNIFQHEFKDAHVKTTGSGSQPAELTAVFAQLMQLANHDFDCFG